MFPGTVNDMISSSVASDEEHDEVCEHIFGFSRKYLMTFCNLAPEGVDKWCYISIGGCPYMLYH